MFGLSSDRLSRRVEQQMREWERANPEPQYLAYGRLQRLLTWASGHALLFLLFVALIATIFAVLLGWVLPEIASLPVLSDDWAKSRWELLGIFHVVWDIQATVIAVVYPIVIAFVALLLQQRNRSMATIGPYMADAAVLPSGLSAIALLLVMGLIELFMLISGTGSLPAFLFGVLLWFAINVVLVGWFLFRTLLYIRPSQRIEIFKQHAVHLIYPKELRLLLAQHIFFDFLDEIESSTKTTTEESSTGQTIAKIDLLPSRDGKPMVTKRFRRAVTLNDVCLDRLTAGINGWMKSVEEHLQHTGDSLPDWAIPTIGFPVIPGEVFRGQATLCRIENADEKELQPDISTRNLIWDSFRFKKARQGAIAESATEVLETLVKDVVTEMLDGDEDRIKQAYRAVMDVHTALLKSRRIVDGSGRMDNAADVVQPYSFGFPHLHQTWANVYSPALEAATAGMPENAVGFRVSCYLAKDLIESVDPEPIKIPMYLLTIHHSLMKRLSTWWSRRIELQETPVHDALHGATLLPPLRETYRRALIQFVGHWEPIELNKPEDHTRTKIPDVVWRQAGNEAQFNVEKLDLTVAMIMEAVQRGDTEATRTLTDCFLELHPSDEWARDTYDYRQKAQPFVTILALENPWPEILGDLVAIPYDREQEVFAARVLATMAMRNYWDDLRILLALMLLRLIVGDDDEAPAFQALCQLLTGKQEFGGLRNSSPLQYPNEFLVPFLRQHFTCTEYRKRFDSIIEEQFDRRFWPEMVPHRSYMSVGHFDLEQLALQRIQSFCLAAPEAAFPVDHYDKLIDRWRKALPGLGGACVDFSAMTRSLKASEIAGSKQLVVRLRRQLDRPTCTRQTGLWTRDCLRWITRQAR